MQIGRPLDVYRAPADMFVARFLGNPPMNLIPARLEERESRITLLVGDTSIDVTSHAPDALRIHLGGPIILGIRPEDIYEKPPAEAGPRLVPVTSRIATVEPLGAETLLTLVLPGSGGEVTARIGRETSLRHGDAAALLLMRRPFTCSTLSPPRLWSGLLRFSRLRQGADMPGEGAIDCHLHVIDQRRFLVAAGIGYTPRADETGTREELAAVLATNGVDHAVIVQPSCYGFDNAATLDTLMAAPGRYRAIAVIDGTAAVKTMQTLRDAGVMGIRCNLASFDPAALTGQCRLPPFGRGTRSRLARPDPCPRRPMGRDRPAPRRQRCPDPR